MNHYDLLMLVLWFLFCYAVKCRNNYFISLAFGFKLKTENIPGEKKMLSKYLFQIIFFKMCEY